MAIIGSGPIGFDVADYLLGEPGPSLSVVDFCHEWGVDLLYEKGSGLSENHDTPPCREIHMLQRKSTKPGENLGKTTGWILRAKLKKNKVQYHSGVVYRAIDEQGLTLEKNGEIVKLAVDTVVVCAGQVSDSGLEQELERAGLSCHVIGGALRAGDLDALAAIASGTALADSL